MQIWIPGARRGCLSPGDLLGLGLLDDLAIALYPFQVCAAEARCR